ncbi:MAG: DUF1795 domain-containing protein [Pyrinomonadaceae bacterium]|jgi:hypothetical protein|nr:DUF1795 domain-containing protein [Pyrinomonadaceae bacterium]
MKLTNNGWFGTLPTGWEDRSMITLTGPIDENGFMANIVVTRDKIEPSMSIEEYAQLQREAMDNEIPNVEVLDERPTTLNNRPAFQRLQKFSLEDQTIQQVQTFVLGKETVFAITGTSSIETFNDSIKAFKEFTESFEVEI